MDENEAREERREAVLEAFMDAWMTLGDAAIEQWAARHPEFAEDIRGYIEFLRRALDLVMAGEPSPEMIEAAERGADENLARALKRIGRAV